MSTFLADVLAADRTAQRVGVWPGLSIEDYHSDRASISKSGLDAIARSPATFFARYLDPARPPEKERAGQMEGSLAHCALLEPDEFDKRYFTLPPDAPRRPTEAQWNAKKSNESSVAAMVWWSEFEERTKGLTLITAQQRTVAMAQAASMRRLPCVAEALAGDFATEESAYAIDPLTGVVIRCRPDLVHRARNGVVLFDVKTYSSAHPDEFERQVARKRYFVQDPYYRDVYSRAAGVDVLGFFFIAVETEYPYLAHPMQLDAESVAVGRRTFRADLDLYARCVQADVWPGYGDDVSTIYLPRWITRKEEFA